MTTALTDIVGLIRERTGDCIDRILRRVVRDSPGSRPAPTAAVRRELDATIDLCLTLLEDDRLPSESELRRCRDIGTRYSQEGASSVEITRGLHIVHQVVWELVSDLAADHPDPGVSAELMARTATMWTALDAMASAIADGHREVVSRIELSDRRRSLAWLRALHAHDPDLEALTRAMDIDPSGPFLSAVHSRPHDPGHGAWDITIERPDHTILFTQPASDGPEAETAVAQRLIAAGAVPAGVGLVRPGLTGALRSLGDAMAAHGAAARTGGEVMCFRQEWLTALTVEHWSDHEPVVARAVEVVREAPRIAEALIAYLDESGNLSRTGSRLGLHPNTVAYRLKQFIDRTGLDPRGTSGRAVAQVVVALAVNPRP